MFHLLNDLYLGLVLLYESTETEAGLGLSTAISFLALDLPGEDERLTGHAHLKKPTEECTPLPSAFQCPDLVWMSWTALRCWNQE